MNKLLILSLLVSLSTLYFGQINWTYSKTDAVEMAQKEGKVIVMDFWAIWCGPCKQMDTKLWDTPEIAAVSDKFIAYKVDVDSDRTTPMQYKLQGIPRVIIITPSGQTLWDRTGFGTPTEFVEVLTNLPDDISDIIAADQSLEENKTVDNYFQAGMSYQALAQNTNHNEIKSKLLSTKIQKEISEGRLVKEDETKLLDLLNSRFIHGEKTMNSSLKLLKYSYVFLCNSSIVIYFSKLFQALLPLTSLPSLSIEAIKRAIDYYVKKKSNNN